MFGIIRSFKAFGVIQKLSDDYIHENSISLNDAQTKIIEIGKSLGLNDRRHIVNEILRLNLKAIQKENLPHERAVEAVLSTSRNFDFTDRDLLRCVLVPYASLYRRDLQSSDGTTPSQTLQTLFSRAAGGHALENSQVIISDKLGPDEESVCIVFKNISGPLVLADNRALPAIQMFMHLDQKYNESSPFRRPYLGFIADVLTCKP